MPIDHFALNVSQDKFQECLDFYIKALKPLGYEKLAQYGPCVVGFGCPPDAAAGPSASLDFWLGGVEGTVPPVHYAFRAQDRATVDSFHQEALAAGAKDNGAPGPRAQYHENYYGAFVLDPVGNNVEAVCHKPQ